MLKIDSHQHFWKYEDSMSDWITSDMSVLRRDFMPEDLEPILKKNGFDGCVTVQVNQTEEENAFQLRNADSYDFIKGVVGWVDLQSPNVEERLGELTQYKKLKGFRHILQGEQDRALMLNPAFLNGIKALSNHPFTYDILIYPDQLKYVPELVRLFPNQRFVIDHLAKPAIKSGKLGEWAAYLKDLKQYENLFCKVSGMVTEADWVNWKPEDFDPYLDVVFETFGANRIMFGSDWPVCQVAGAYDEVVSIAENYVSKLALNEQMLIWGLNAERFYNLK
jgi:L-fuconolactonase